MLRKITFAIHLWLHRPLPFAFVPCFPSKAPLHSLCALCGSRHVQRWVQRVNSDSGLCFAFVLLHTALNSDVAKLFRSVSERDIMFGKGGFKKAVSLFEEQHVCNYYCEWPGFGLDCFVVFTCSIWNLNNMSVGTWSVASNKFTIYFVVTVKLNMYIPAVYEVLNSRFGILLRLPTERGGPAFHKSAIWSSYGGKFDEREQAPTILYHYDENMVASLFRFRLTFTIVVILHITAP
jgi:hypothetical protein